MTTSLIKRLTEAEGPLDNGGVAMLIAALRRTHVRHFSIHRGDGGEDEMTIAFANGAMGCFSENNWPDRSLDAAVSAVPYNAPDRLVFWRVGNDGEGANPAAFKAEILLAGKFTSPAFRAVAAAAPLAMCIAILKALEAKDE